MRPASFARLRNDQYIGQMQPIFNSRVPYGVPKTTLSPLKICREAAGISQRELARLIGERQSNIQYWETPGRLPRSEVLITLANTLGVTLEDLLGIPRGTRKSSSPGRAWRLFQAVAKMPRDQQAKVIDLFERAFMAYQGKARQR